MKRSSLLASIILASSLLSGCSLYDSLVYKIDIEQGNYLIKESTLTKLKPNMTAQQVEYVLGTPMLVDRLDPNTWYYIYNVDFARGESIEKKLVVHFNKQARLDKLSGDYKIPASFYATK